MNELITFVDHLANWILQISSEHGVLLSMLAFLGLISIVSAIGQKVFVALKYLFMIFVAIPAILIVGLANKNYRKERLKDLGEIKSHLKQHPDKFKRILYVGLLCLFVLIVIVIVYIFIQKFILPFNEFNEASKVILQNYSNSSLQ